MAPERSRTFKNIIELSRCFEYALECYRKFWNLLNGSTVFQNLPQMVLESSRRFQHNLEHSRTLQNVSGDSQLFQNLAEVRSPARSPSRAHVIKLNLPEGSSMLNIFQAVRKYFKIFQNFIEFSRRFEKLQECSKTCKNV